MKDFEKGFLLGLLAGGGHVGGDGLQPHVHIKMHVRHEPLLRWVQARVPGSRLYGPYHHGGRAYFQWMVRGDAFHHHLVPMLKTLPWNEIDPHSHGRFLAMLEKYAPYTLSPQAVEIAPEG